MGCCSSIEFVVAPDIEGQSFSVVEVAGKIENELIHICVLYTVWYIITLYDIWICIIHTFMFCL